MSPDHVQDDLKPRIENSDINAKGARTLTVDEIKRVRGGAGSSMAAMALAMRGPEYWTV